MLIPKAQIPVTITKVLHEKLQEAGASDSLLLANGSNYAAIAPYWLDSWTAAESQILRILESDLTAFPGLVMLSEGIQPRQTIIPAIRKAFNEQVLHIQEEPFIEALLSLSTARFDKPFGLGETFDLMLQAPMLFENGMQFRESNLSQYHRQKALMMRAYAFDILRMAMNQLERLCSQSGFMYSIRPCFAMHSSKRREIHSQILRGGLSVPELYLSPGQQKVIQSLKQNNMDIVDQLINGSMNDPVDDYLYWYFNASYITVESDDQIIAFGRWNVPATFFERPEEGILYFNHPPRYSFHIDMAVHFLDRFYFGGPVRVHNTIPAPLIAIADLLPVIAGALEIISISTSTGHGQHKPSWTAAPVNRYFIDSFKFAAAHAINQANGIH